MSLNYHTVADMQITKVLEHEVGIQFSSVKISDGLFLNNPLVQPIIIGKFKRGRLDHVMLITQQNIRAVLGHDSFNSDYQIVQDYLNTGVPSIHVFRVID